jgi:hypothetical protein
MEIIIIVQGECPALIINSCLLRCRNEPAKSPYVFDSEFRRSLETLWFPPRPFFAGITVAIWPGSHRVASWDMIYDKAKIIIIDNSRLF